MNSLKESTKFVLVQNKSTDLYDVTRHRIEGYLKDRGFFLETFILKSKHDVVPSLDYTPDIVLVIGGDGSLLKAIRRFPEGPIVIGVNTGHLGFLTSINADSVESYLEALIAGEWIINQRLKICISETSIEALNDIVFKSNNPSHMAKINTYLICHDGTQEEFADYDADGLIIATPTGSTAYNMAAGGSIIDPNTKVIAVTPICPHSLSAKPIIISPEYPIVVESDLSNEENLIVSVDGEDVLELSPGSKIIIKDEGKTFELVRFPGLKAGNYYSLLKKKLGWNANLRANAIKNRKF